MCETVKRAWKNGDSADFVNAGSYLRRNVEPSLGGRGLQRFQDNSLGVFTADCFIICPPKVFSIVLSSETAKPRDFSCSVGWKGYANGDDGDSMVGALFDNLARGSEGFSRFL